MKIKIILLALFCLVLSPAAHAQSGVAPDAVVRNLYAAHKGHSGPFFQTKSRARLYKYLNKELADLIWKDAIASKGEVGALDFDPLYNAQDLKITAFKIGKPEYGEGNNNLADVPVTFKNMGTAETVLFRLERTSPKSAWKLSDIFYPSNPHDSSSLKEIFLSTMKASHSDTAPETDLSDGLQKIDYLLLQVDN